MLDKFGSSNSLIKPMLTLLDREDLWEVVIVLNFLAFTCIIKKEF